MPRWRSSMSDPSPIPRAPRLALLAVATFLFVTACAVGPDHVRPTVPTPERFARAELQAPATAIDSRPMSQRPADAEFWLGFGDPLLVRLVDDTLAANHDLRVALARYDRANALLRGARFDRLPTITASAEAADVRASADQAPGVARADRDGESYSGAIVAGWELDLFGRIRRNVESQS